MFPKREIFTPSQEHKSITHARVLDCFLSACNIFKRHADTFINSVENELITIRTLVQRKF